MQKDALLRLLLPQDDDYDGEARRGEDGDDGSNDVTTVIRDDDYDGNDDGEDYDSDNQPTLAVLLDHWWHPC